MLEFYLICILLCFLKYFKINIINKKEKKKQI